MRIWIPRRTAKGMDVIPPTRKTDEPDKRKEYQKRPMLKNDLLLRAARRERTSRPPVWFMRQAGRTDPQYQALRRRSGLELEAFFRDSDLAAEASLLPRRVGVDAIILFQDILTPLAPMGAGFVFRPGPLLKAGPASAESLKRLRSIDPPADLPFVGATLQKIHRALDGALPVLGFAGAPFTLAAFLIEGSSPMAGMPRTLTWMRDDPTTLHNLLTKLAAMTVDYLRYQIEQGVHTVQLFESAADLLTPADYETFAHPYQTQVFAGLDGTVPTMLFAKEQTRIDLMVETGANVLSIGSNVDLREAKRQFGHRVAFQGNVDNRLVAQGTGDAIDEAVYKCVDAGASEGHILNLSHGLLKETPWENVQRFVDAANRAGRPHAPSTVGGG